MKTIPLDELLQQTSPLPFKPWPANADNFGAILDAEGNDVWLSGIEDYASDRAKHEACNMALLAHAANVLPEVVEALGKVKLLLAEVRAGIPGCNLDVDHEFDVVSEAITKATQVPIA